MKIGILIGVVVGARLGQSFALLPVTDRSPATRALRVVNRIATEHGLTQRALLKAMTDHQDGAAPRERLDEAE